MVGDNISTSIFHSRMSADDTCSSSCFLRMRTVMSQWERVPNFIAVFLLSQKATTCILYQEILHDNDSRTKQSHTHLLAIAAVVGDDDDDDSDGVVVPLPFPCGCNSWGGFTDRKYSPCAGPRTTHKRDEASQRRTK